MTKDQYMELQIAELQEQFAHVVDRMGVEWVSNFLRLITNDYENSPKSRIHLAAGRVALVYSLPPDFFLKKTTNRKFRNMFFLAIKEKTKMSITEIAKKYFEQGVNAKNFKIYLESTTTQLKFYKEDQEIYSKITQIVEEIL